MSRMRAQARAAGGLSSEWRAPQARWGCGPAARPGKPQPSGAPRCLQGTRWYPVPWSTRPAFRLPLGPHRPGGQTGPVRSGPVRAALFLGPDGHTALYGAPTAPTASSTGAPPSPFRSAAAWLQAMPGGITLSLQCGKGIPRASRTSSPRACYQSAGQAVGSRQSAARKITRPLRLLCAARQQDFHRRNEIK